MKTVEIYNDVHASLEKAAQVSGRTVTNLASEILRKVLASLAESPGAPPRDHDGRKEVAE